MSKKEGGGGDELDGLKAKVLATQMEIVAYMDTVRRTQERSMQIEHHIDTLTEKSREKIRGLEDIISLINSDAKVKDNHIHELETNVAKLTEDLQGTIKNMTNEMENAKANFEFKYASLTLELEAAQIKLRELHEFGIKKTQLEKELQDTRAALLKEHESKIEMVGEAERASYAAQEKMRKQMENIVAETEARMTKTIELQLHAKTKRTIIENEELKTEVQYHTHATTTLLKENERLIKDNHELSREVNLVKEIQVQLEQRMYMYQKTMHILVRKLQEKEKQLEGTKAKLLSEMTPGEREDEDDFQELLMRAKHLDDVKSSPTPKKSNPKRSAGQGKGGYVPDQKITQESAIEFLYACLEDMELNTFTRVAAGGAETSEVPSDVPLDQLNAQQRRALLQSLLKRATGVRVLTQSLTNATNRNAPRHQPYTPVINQSNPGGNITFDVQSVLDIPVKDIMANEAGDRSHDDDLLKGL